MIGAPSSVRDELVELTKRTFVNRCLELQPETEKLLELIDDPDRSSSPAEARSGICASLEGSRRRGEGP